MQKNTRSHELGMPELDRIIAENLNSFTQLCRIHHVNRIEVFGSSGTDRFDPESSDLDFIVVFDELTPTESFEAYFGLLEGLQELFQLPIDLLVESKIRNPYFLNEIEKTRAILYAA